MNQNTGHGHVRPRPDGIKARCGGPGICDECAREAAALGIRFDLPPNVRESAPCEVHIATPMHDGGGAGDYAKSLFHLGYALGQCKIPCATAFHYGDSVAQSRSFIATEFLASSATHLFFIDSDIEFDARDAVTMLAMSAAADSPYDVITGAYPKKKFPVEQNFNTLEPITRLDRPAVILDNGCGFMLIRRATLVRLAEAHPELAYMHHDGRRRIRFFQDGVIDGVFLAEDRWFCRLVRSAGMRIWLCPWIKLNHVGQHVFDGDLERGV